MSAQDTVVISFRVPRLLAIQLDEIAHEDQRTRASFIVSTLTQAVAVWPARYTVKKMKRDMKNGEILPELDIPFADLGKLSVRDLLSIDGPKFITNRKGAVGGATLAVVISHDKWIMLNHHIPDVKRAAVTEFFVGGQAYLTIPVERDVFKFWRPVAETGLDIVTLKKPRKTAVA
jgi:predicted transcriptional regulator